MEFKLRCGLASEEGILFYPSFMGSIYTTFCLLPLSNFPDVSLPALKIIPEYYIYFGAVLALFQFILLALCLSIFYESYTDLMQESAVEIMESLLAILDQVDEGKYLRQKIQFSSCVLILKRKKKAR